MSVKCFNDVMQNAIEVRIGKMPVRIASLSGQFLIKLDAWLDRNDRTMKDAYDMMYILSLYYDVRAVVEGITPPSSVDLNVEDNSDGLIILGAMWLADDISHQLSIEHLQYYAEILARELGYGADSRLIVQCYKSVPKDSKLTFEDVYSAWERIRLGLEREMEIKKCLR